MTRLIRASMVALSLAAVAGLAQPRAQGGPTPYKLGMFQQGDRTFVGMVLKDEIVIDLSRTIAGTPSTLKALIEQWGPPTASRFASVASDATSNPPASAMKVSQLKLLPPITDPKVLLSTAVNYQEHAMEMRSTTHDGRERRGGGSEGRARHPRLLGPRVPATLARTLLLREGQHRDHGARRPDRPAEGDAPRSTGNAR